MSTGHEATTSRYLCVFTHLAGGGTTAKMFANNQEAQANACAKKASLAHRRGKVEVVAICERGQNILATWTNGQRDGAKRWIPYARAAAVAALALILVSPAHAAPPTFELPVHPPDTYLAGCAITTHDDGSRLAQCPEDGAVLVWDADGQRFVNEAGAPIRAAGWYVLE